MVLKSKNKVQAERAFEFKGRMLTLTVLNVIENDLAAIDQQLGEKIAQAPEFFRNSSIVIDANIFDSIDLKQIANIIRGHHMVPVGIIGGNLNQEQLAADIGLGVFPKIKAVSSDKSDKKTKNNNESETDLTNSSAEKQQTAENTQEQLVSAVEITKSPTMLIKQPVRSGQQIYAKGGDLVVMSSVGAGAEVLADGHIHIYGSLRGRALAGVQGDTQARIFCNNLDAELISIAGQYKISDDIPADAKNGLVQIYLDDEQMKIQGL